MKVAQIVIIVHLTFQPFVFAKFIQACGFIYSHWFLLKFGLNFVFIVQHSMLSYYGSFELNVYP